MSVHDAPSPRLIEQCVHCGFCLPACPTYALWGEEMDSPRGRIYLMKAAADGRVQMNADYVQHFDACLGCVACVTACPSGVQYGTLIEQARAQIETSFQRIKKGKIDLIQVHNMGDVKTQVPILRDMKAQGRIRYLGVTTTFEPQYPEIVALMKAEPLDFIGVDYAIDNREVETTLLPLARDRGIGVLVYAPFGRTRLFKRVGDRPVPDWAAEFHARTWAQFFLKFALSHPAVTVVTPATSQAKNMVDNLAGGVGRLPDEAMRRRMVAFVDALPSAG